MKMTSVDSDVMYLSYSPSLLSQRVASIKKGAREKKGKKKKKYQKKLKKISNKDNDNNKRSNLQ